MEASSMVGPTDAEALRARLHGMWAAVADGWAEHADYVDTRAAVATDRLLELAAPRPGERVLELACGPGGLGLAAAMRVAPGGGVVLSDVAAEMTAIAAARAEGLGLTNVSTRELDLEHIDEPDGCYDVVLCREGLMFAPDPAAAVREMGRVLRPDGRVALAVWGPRERNPWLGLVLDAASAQLGKPVPPPGVPARSRSTTPTGWPACSAMPPWTTWPSASWPCRCELGPSRSGGRGRPRWRGRWRRCSPRCPKTRDGRFAPGPARRSATTRHPTASSSQA
jgi:SAM-dependent methyltransferase